MWRKENCYGSTRSKTTIISEINVEEKILKAKLVEQHVEKIRDLYICEQHGIKASSLLLETTKEVALKSCEKFMESKGNDDVKVCNHDLNMNV